MVPAGHIARFLSEFAYRRRAGATTDEGHAAVVHTPLQTAAGAAHVQVVGSLVGTVKPLMQEKLQEPSAAHVGTAFSDGYVQAVDEVIC